MNTTTVKKQPNWFLKTIIGLLSSVLLLAGYTMPQMQSSRAKAESLEFTTQQQQDPEIPTSTPTRKPVATILLPTATSNQPGQEPTPNSVEMCNEAVKGLPMGTAWGWDCSNLSVEMQPESPDDNAGIPADTDTLGLAGDSAELSMDIEVQEMFETCKEMLEEEDFTWAWGCSTELIERDPTFAGGYVQRATAGLHLGKELNELLGDIDTALKLQSDYAPAYYVRFVAVWARTGQEYLPDLDLAIQLDPNYFEALATRGVGNRNIWKWEDAASDLTRAIKLIPENVRPEMGYAIYFNRGIAFYYLEKWSDAVNDFTEAIKFLPQSVEAYYNRALAYKANGNVENFLADIELVLKADPSYSTQLQSSLTDIQELLTTLDAKDAAYARLKELINTVEQSTSEAQRLFNEGMKLRNEVGIGEGYDYLKEIEFYDQAIKFDPQFAPAYLERAKTRNIWRTDLPNVMDDLNIAIQINPEYAEAYLERSKLYMRQGMDTEAMADLKTAILINPHYFEAYLLSAEYHTSRRMNEEKLVDLTMMIETMPDDLPVEDIHTIYSARAPLFLEKEMWKEAIADYSKAIELNPDVAEHYFGRGKAYITMRNIPGLVADLTKALKMNPPYRAELQNDLLKLHELLAKVQKGSDSFVSLSKFIEQLEQTGDGVTSSNPEALKSYREGLESLREVEGATILDGGALHLLSNAKASFDNAITLDPEFAAAYVQQAKANAIYRGSAEQILNDLNKAIELQPDYAEAYVERAKAYLWEQEPMNEKAALADFDKALELKPDCFEAFTARGKFYNWKQQWGEAITDFAKAKEVMPDDVTAFSFYDFYLDSGLAFLSQNMISEAVAEFSEALTRVDEINGRTAKERIVDVLTPIQKKLEELTPSSEQRIQLENGLTQINEFFSVSWDPK